VANKRRANSTLAVIYWVEQDPVDGRWNVKRGGVPTGAFALDKATVIGQGYQAASGEANTSNLKVTVYSVQNGKRLTEWKVHNKTPGSFRYCRYSGCQQSTFTGACSSTSSPNGLRLSGW
jgi:hypothetical protein